MPTTNCAGVTRRDCLQLGLGTLLGGGLVTALRARGFAAEGVNAPAKANSCILIWQDGGPTHYEMFDPKPDAPAEYRGEFKAIPTSVPGVQFSEHMTKLAKGLDKFAVMRSELPRREVRPVRRRRRPEPPRLQGPRRCVARRAYR